MATKLGRKEFPNGHLASDFTCFGPPATEDGNFESSMMADLGCFNQDGKDSNKMYFAAVVQSKKNSGWFTYFEWGRTGASNRDFQFIQCSSKDEAQREMAKQCHDKNDKRGEWKTVGSVKLLKAKPGKDVYLVRNLAKREAMLPDAQSICSEGAAPAAKAPVAKKGGKPSYRADSESTRLMRDLLGGAVAFTKSNIQGGNIPSQKSIEAARDIIQETLKRIVKVGDDVKDQINDTQMRDLTFALFGLIPKKKELHCPDEDWILSNFTSNVRRQSTIDIWKQDLDAFESALKAGTIEETSTGDDPLASFPADFNMEWIDPKTETGQYLLKWWPKASRNRHSVGEMKIKNLWRIRREGDDKAIRQAQETILKHMQKSWNEERPLHQDMHRPDLTPEEKELFWKTNTALTFHGTRTVNVPGICRENLRLPKTLVGVVITGAMFGGGLYFADDWKKSNGYTSDPGSYWSSGSGAVKGRQAFMFACDTVMGIPHVAPGPRGYTSPPNGSHCVFGKGGHSNVQNNEWIVFERGRNNLRYLAEYSTR